MSPTVKSAPESSVKTIPATHSLLLPPNSPDISIVNDIPMRILIRIIINTANINHHTPYNDNTTDSRFELFAITPNANITPRITMMTRLTIIAPGSSLTIVIRRQVAETAKQILTKTINNTISLPFFTKIVQVYPPTKP